MNTEARDALTMAHARLMHPEYPIGCDGEGSHEEYADDILALLATIPEWTLARTQDAEDGAELRELREALPDGFTYTLSVKGHQQVMEVWTLNLWAKVGEWHGPTIAAVARKAREAL